ncbi:MAG: response regulator, partial [Propionibacteriales bacterium]|nr:response regulator [Propionibacteriales bacterium]
MSDQAPAQEQATILLYSNDRTVRDAVRSALGRRVAADLPLVEVIECATQKAAIAVLDEKRIDLCIFDGEATPAGGLGLCRQIKDEIVNCPPVLVLVGRIQDAWLATWSRAEGVMPHPIDPIKLPGKAADLLRGRLASG